MDFLIHFQLDGNEPMPTYFNSNALLSQRSSGYKGTAYAIAELVDNSFDANASECRIIIISNKVGSTNKIDEILIVDDGDGMTDGHLESSLQFGGTTNDDMESMVATKKIGKFGYGLPSASISQCKEVAVYSWTKTDDYRKTTLNLQELIDENSIDIPPIEEVALPAYFAEVSAVINSSKGTIVSWKDCDRLSHSMPKTILDNTESLIGSIFRHYLKNGKKVSLLQFDHARSTNTYAKVESRKAKINDPLFLSSNAKISEDLYKESNKSEDTAEAYQRYSVSKTECKPTNSKLEDCCFPYVFEWQGNGYKFDIITSVVNKDIQKPAGKRDGGNTAVGKFYARKQSQSISFVRSDREIATGSFYGCYNKTDSKSRWWSVEVAFTPDADDLLGVHVNKQGVDFRKTEQISVDDVFDKHASSLVRARTQLWIELTRHIMDCIRQAKKLVNTQEVSPIDDDDIIPGPVRIVTTVVKSTDGKRQGKILEGDKEILITRLVDKFPRIPEESIKEAVDIFDKSEQKSTILYHSNDDSTQLWSKTSVSGFLVVLINTSHPFYETHMHGLRESGNESTLGAIELFINALAIESYKPDTEEEENTISDYTTQVSIHLKRYLVGLNAEGKSS
jgi:hypothetical protein